MEQPIHRAARRVGLALLWLLGSLATCQAATARLVVRPWPVSVAHVLAGNISRAEYFVDADPGLGNGTAIPLTPGADISGLTYTVNLSTLTTGFHRLSTRTQDVGGVWSLTNTRSFYYQNSTTSTTPPLANITKAEYFIDAEPGLGNGVDIPVATPGTDVSGLGFIVNLTPLTNGFHRLSTRTRDANGLWSLTNTRSFYYQNAATSTTPPLANIIKAEYFIDAEPGLGNGVDIPVATPGTDVSGLAFVVNLAPLTNGFHRLSTRTRDANGLWSLTNTRSFYYLPASAIPGPPANITRVEYYFDTDPGFGSATNVPIATLAPDVANVGYAADLSVLSDGAHRLFLRSRDADGKWSLVSNTAFTKSGCASAVSYAAGLPAASYLGTNTSGTLTSSASVAFNTNPAAPTTGNSPSYGNTGTLQADLGTSQTISEVRLRLTALGVANNITITTQTAATTAGPFTTIDTYVAPLVVNTPLLVARPLAMPVSARVLRFQLQSSNASYLVIVSGAEIFNLNCVMPSITTVAPNAGPAGTIVTITGANLQGTSVLTFAGASNNTVLSGFTVSSDGTQITGVMVPGGAATGNVTATTPNGTSNGVNFTVTAGPSLVSIAPASGVVGSTVVLNGANLTGTTLITFAGTANNTVATGYAVNVAGTQITGIVVPSGAATGNVSVTTPGGTSNGVLFTVTLPVPVLSSLNPTSGPVGTSVTISGTNLSGATSVSFNGTAQTTIASNTASSLVVAVPTGATTGNVTVTTPNGTSNGLTFTVTNAQLAVSQSGTSYPSNGPAYNFGSQVQNTSSSAVAFTLTNAGTAPLTISSISTSGNYTTTGANPTSVAAGSTGTVSVVFSPTATGTRPGTLMIVSSLGNYTVNLTGTGSVAPPALTSLSPSNGPVGTSVTLTGTDLSGATSVSFNGTTVASASFISSSATSIVLNIPTGTTTGLVTVTTPAGTSNGLTFTVTNAQLAVSQGGTSYPSNGPAYSFGSQVQNTSSSAVAFTLTNAGTAPLTISSITATGDFATSGAIPTSVAAGSTGTVSAVFTPTATGARLGTLVVVSNAGTYTLNLSGTGMAPLPTITSFTPASGPVGTSVTLTGTNLTGTTAVAFNGTTAPGFVVNVAGTQLTVSVPSGASTGLLSVTTPGGTATSGTSFTVTVPAPTLTSLNPNSAPVGTTIIVNGTGLTGTTSIAFAGTSNNVVTSGFAVNAAGTQITGVVVPGGATTGNVTATTPNGTSNGLSFTVTVSSPTITSFTPASGPVGTSVVLTGTNLTGTTAVAFNGTTAPGFVVNAAGTQITVAVPSGATTGLLNVTTPNGTATSGSSFTVTLPDLMVSTGTPLSPTAIPAGSYNSITVTGTGNGILSGNVNVAAFLTVQTGGGLSDGCSVIGGAGSFTLAAGSTLGICNAQGISSSGATGSVQVTGIRSFSTGASYSYTGAAAATGSGLPGVVLNLAINTAGNVALTAPVAVTQVLGVGGAGNLVLNGQVLTLLSSAAGTALVVNSSTGVVSGTATAQRYIDPSLNAGAGYRHFSAPVSNTTVADLATVGFAPGISQAAVYNASPTPGTTMPFPTVFGYDQGRVTLSNTYAPFDRGFVVPMALSTPLVVGQGYAVNIASTQLVDFMGTLNNGPLTMPLARVASNPDAGWQLLGNPYPAPLDYMLVAPIDRVNLDGAIYVYSSTAQYTGQYRSYVNGVGDNQVLPVGQGFFARVSAGQTSGSFTFRNSQRLTTPNATAFQRTATDTRPLVQLNLRGATGPADALYAYAQAGATPAFDSQLDAEKIANPTGLNLSSTATSGQRLAIDGRPVFDAVTVLPLSVGVPAAGLYSLTAGALNNIPAGLDAYLTDAQTGQTVNLRQQPTYSFSVTAVQATALLTGRFFLRFSASVLATAGSLTAAEVALYPNPANARFTVLMPGVPGATAVQAELVNSLGQVMRRQTAALPISGATLTVETADLATGVYTLRLQAGPVNLAKRVMLQ